MRINTSETFLGRMLQQNKTLFVGNLTVSLRNVKQEKDLNDIAQAKESEIAEAVSNKDLIVERIQKMAEQSLSITLLTLEEMKTLAVLAMNESLSNGERIDLQKKMTELQFQLHENTSSLGLSLAGKSYEDVKHMKTLAVGINNSQDFDIATQLRLAEEQNILHRDADIYTWDRNGGVIVSFVLASKEEVASKKAEKINNWDQFNHDMYFEQAKSGDPSFQNVPMLFSTGSARRTVMMLDKRIEKVNKMQEELSEFKTLSNAEKLAPFYPKNNGIYSSLMGDTAYISYGYDGKQNDFILEHVQNKT
ncbi:MAG: hypothetical protein FWH52_06300, partial [Synergistaceae bacterium]|nr:hypothetical protein [Synergistaceae bacterium]